jgi:hypothetical protein
MVPCSIDHFLTQCGCMFFILFDQSPAAGICRELLSPNSAYAVA